MKICHLSTGTMFTSLIVFLLAIGQSDATCYDTSGNEHDVFIPCNASAEVSVCCAGSDYCLDNGLCLDADGDNIFTVQGCTSRTWDAPCKQYCPGLPPTTNLYQDLSLCRWHDRVSSEYCCGQDASCCSDTASFITLPIFTSVYRGASAGAAGATAPQFSASSSPSSTPPTASSPSEKATNNGFNLGLFLGLLLGFGLLSSTLLFVALELRKRNAYLRMGHFSEKSRENSDGNSRENSQGNSQDVHHELTHPPTSPRELHSNVFKPELPGDQSFCSRPSSQP